MTRTTADKREAFRAMHETGCFIIPNPWDAGSARYLQGLGFNALATTSAGVAWAAGRSDNGIDLEMALAHLHEIVRNTDVPINADFENGFAESADGVAKSVALAIKTGIAGVSIEDSTGDKHAPQFSIAVAVDRLRAARQAIDDLGGDTLLIGRAENFFSGRPDLADTVARIEAYADAGADVLYAPGISTEEQIRAVVAAAGGKPVNFLAGAKSPFTLSQLAKMGVRRVSIGGGLSLAAWGGFQRAALALAAGRLDGFGEVANGRQLNDFFRISREQPLDSHPARITGDVEYREGDGMSFKIPPGAIEVQTSPVDAVISWMDGQQHNVVAMPIANFCQYVADGAISIAVKPALPQN